MNRLLFKKRRLGFTLIELIIVIAIIGILTSIAVPLYTEQMVKTRRTDGQIALLDLAARMERYYAENHTFASASIAAGNSATDVLGSNQSPENHYTLTIANQSATTFLIQATPNGTQATQDTKCANLRINQLGQKTETGTGTAEECW